MKYTLCCLTVCTITAFSSLFSQSESDSTKKKETSGWLALPFASYSPETEWAFGVAGFINGTKFAYGLGFRLNVIPDEKISLRADFGFSNGEGQLYLGFGEAF